MSSSCDPITTNQDLANMGIKYYYWDDKPGSVFAYGNEKNPDGTPKGVPLVPEDVAVPCGLIAKSMFNDTFSLWSDE